MKKIYFLAACVFYTSIGMAQTTLTNDETHITINGIWDCSAQFGNSYQNGPPVSGQYEVRVEWFDFQNDLRVYQSATPNHDPLIITNADQPNQSILINATSLTGFQYYPELFPAEMVEGYDFNSISDLTITITELSQNRKWIITFSYGIYGSCVIVPVDLVSFTGQVPSNNHAIANLYWQTESENNVSKYVIERSNNAINFQIIGEVTSVNTQSVHYYTFTDNVPSAAYQYYRLRVVGIDGETKKYSPVVYLNGLTPVTQPGGISCSYTMSGPTSFCTPGVRSFELSSYPNYSNVTWSAVPFYNYTNALYLNYNHNAPGGAKLVISKPNVITLTANVSRCTSGGTIVKYIFKGIPDINASVTSTTQTNTCTGMPTSNTSTVTITPFPGTSASNYDWYYNSNYIGTGLTNNLINSDTISKNYEVRFNGPCGMSIYTGIVAGISSTPCTPPELVVVHTYQSTVDPCYLTVNSSSTTVTVTPLPCTTALDYYWYVNGTYYNRGLTFTFNTYRVPGKTYEIRYTGPCGISTISGSVGREIIPIEDYSMSPNPASGNFVVTNLVKYCPPANVVEGAAKVNPNSSMISSIEIFDNFGRSAKIIKLKTPSNSVNVNTLGIKKGLYRVKINYADGYVIKQIQIVD